MAHRTTRLPRRSFRLSEILATLAALLLASAPVTPAQTVIGVSESIDFDRPEAWAQKYFTSVTMVSGFGVPKRIARGSFGLEFEAANVPTVGPMDRRVGFNGTKEEDLNKVGWFGRIGGTVGLPWQLSLTALYTPPIEVGGATPNLLGLALGRPVIDGNLVRIGVRLHGQVGTVEGDFTCSESAVAAGDDPAGNPFSCEKPSNDAFQQRYLGAEIGSAFPLRTGRVEPFLTASANYIDTRFQVNASYSGIVDRSALETHGWTWYFTGGSNFVLSDHWSLALEMFYSPLDVLPQGYVTADTHGLLNARILVRRQLR